MTRLEVASAACRNVALVLYASAVVMVAASASRLVSDIAFDAEDTLAGSLRDVLMAIAAGLCGLYLWIRAGSLAYAMVDESDEPVTRGDLNQAVILSTTCAVLGLIIIVRTVRFFVFLLCHLLTIDSPWSLWWQNFGWKSELYGSVVELVFGVWLLFGSSGLVKLVR